MFCWESQFPNLEFLKIFKYTVVVPAAIKERMPSSEGQTIENNPQGENINFGAAFILEVEFRSHIERCAF